MQDAVERSIRLMWERYDEPISLADLAEAAILSRFYFSRVFRTITGTSPGRFLSAIRIHQAKGLLRESSMSVTDISYQVGYNSPGTFTSRFTRSVGLTPTQYRDPPGATITQPNPPDSYPADEPAVRGVVHLPETDTSVRVYVAAFRTPIPEGMPFSCDVLDVGRRKFELYGLADGPWFIRAAAVPDPEADPSPGPDRRRPLFVSGGPSLTVKAGRSAETEVLMHPMSIFDLPVLLALPELDSREQLPVLASVGY